MNGLRKGLQIEEKSDGTSPVRDVRGRRAAFTEQVML